MQEITFGNITELNSYINKHPNSIAFVDVKNLTVHYKGSYTAMALSTTSETRYFAYILFANNGAYNEFKETSLIPIDYDFHAISSVRVYITLDEFANLRDAYNIEIIELADKEAQEEPVDVIVGGITYTDTPNWGADKAMLHHAWTRGYSGEGVKIAVIDTAFRSTDPLLTPIKEHIIFEDGSTHPIATHGDMCISACGTRLDNSFSVGTAPQSTLYALETNLKHAKIFEAYHWCIDNKIDIISMSYGNSRNSPLYTENLLLKAMSNAGIIAIAAAGNNPEDAFYYPAMHEDVISVGGVKKNSDGSLAPPFYGATNQPWIDFVFSGESVAVTRLSLDALREPIVLTFSGTSAAAPGFVGFVACIKQEFPEWSKQQILDHMKVHSFDVPDRYGVFPLYHNPIINTTRLAKVTKDGVLRIKGNKITSNSIRFTNSGDMHVRGYEKGKFAFKKDGSVRATKIIENAEI